MFGFNSQQPSLFGSVNQGDIEIPESQLGESFTEINWSPQSDYLVGASWDCNVRCWQIKNGKGEPRAMQTYSAPVLSSCFSADGPIKIFSGDCSNKAYCWDVTTNQSFEVAQHDKPVSIVQHLPLIGSVLMTGSWDKMIKYWDGKQNGPVLQVNVPDKIFSADTRSNLLVVACANRKICIYDLRNPRMAYKTIDSPLKFQTRCVSTFMDYSGFAVGSIEGRVAIYNIVDGVDVSDQNFAFKCHRDGSSIYAINAISHHPTKHGVFATMGSDGHFNFWDKNSKQRIKDFGKCAQPIVDGKFNHDGSLFAYASCYDWCEGLEGYKKTKMQDLKSHIYLHHVQENEVTASTKK